MIRPRRWLAASAAAALLSACSTAPAPPPATIPPTEGAIPLAALPGWSAEDHRVALESVRYACRTQPLAGRSAVCAEASMVGSDTEDAARRFLEAHFRAEPVAGEGLLTGYFSPAYDARRSPDAEFSAPVLPLRPGAATTLSRAQIERLPATDVLAWMRPEELFFLQVQGSGTLAFPDGARQRAVFAGSNNLPFVAIARTMVAEGLIPASAASASGVRGWLAAHRGPEADAEMDRDPRYIFFRLVPDDGGEPQGASGAALLPGRSLAIDPAHHDYFELLWIDARAPTLTGAHPTYQRLAIALDRGGAITGPARADLYVGSGPDAGEEAARIRHTLHLYRLVPASP